MLYEPDGDCWCRHQPNVAPVPAEADAQCLCPGCLCEGRMLTDPATIRAEHDQLDAAVKAAARPALPPDAAPGERLNGCVDHIAYPGGYRAAVGPTRGTSRYLSTARSLLLRDLGRSH